MLVVGVCLTGAALAAIIVMTPAGQFSDTLFRWAIGSAFIFAIATWMLRLVLARNVDRTFLVGRLPFALLLVKLVGVVTVLVLLALWPIGLAVGDGFHDMTSRALITGLIGAAVLMIATTGVLNLLAVYRRLAGTLETTSRPHAE
jgi:hypothetical protein